METASFNVPSITCSICSGKIRDELGHMNGVQNVDVDLKSQTVKVGYDPGALQPQDIKSRITSMGYEIIS